MSFLDINRQAQYLHLSEKTSGGLSKMTGSISQIEQNPAFQLKGSLFTLTVLHLLNADLLSFTEQLTELVKQTPKFFHFMPIVLDLQKMHKPTIAIDFAGIMKVVRELNIILVGVRGGNPEQHKEAQQIGLAIFPNAKADPKDASNKNSKSDPAKVAVPINARSTGSKLITQPVRSGQQIYARNADLIVLAPVSHGAELLADGHIHVYGTLRGRALAGVMGDQNARIFCQSLEADLIAIAGHYWVSEDLQNSSIKQNVHVYLENERLHVKTL